MSESIDYRVDLFYYFIFDVVYKDIIMKKLFYNLLVSGLLLTKINAQELNIESEMVSKISLLGEENSFVYIDLSLTPENLDLIDQLKFDLLPEGASTQYNRYGDLHLINDELSIFFKEIGNNDQNVISVVAEVIAKTTQQVVRASNKDSAWLSVRVSKPNSFYDIPRWHVDGQYYGFNNPSPNPELIFKFAATLKGSSTLLYNLPHEQRDIFIEHCEDRQFLSEFLDLNKAESPKRGEGVIFVVANDKIAAVHSEPPVHENRLFFSILLGDKSEIEELYPRNHPKPNE